MDSTAAEAVLAATAEIIYGADAAALVERVRDLLRDAEVQAIVARRARPTGRRLPAEVRLALDDLDEAARRLAAAMRDSREAS